MSDLLAVAQNGGGSSGGAAGGGYDATCYQMIETAVSSASVDAGWLLADRRDVFDRLIFNLYGKTIQGKTAAEAFDSAADSLVLAQTPALITALNASSYLASLGRAGSAMNAYRSVYMGDVSTAVYDNETYDPGHGVYDFCWSDDGTKLYTIDDDYIYEHVVGTPWRVSTASATGASFYIRNIGMTPTYPRGIDISKDGSTIYVVFDGHNRIYEFELTTPFDLSTLVNNNTYYYDAGAFDNMWGLHLTKDSQYIFTSLPSDIVYRKQFSAGFFGRVDYLSVSELPLDTAQSPISEGSPYGFAASRDGRMFALCGGTEKIQNLAIPDDDADFYHYDAFQTAVFTAPHSDPRGVQFSRAGDKMFYTKFGTPAGIHQFSVDPITNGVFEGV